MSGYVILRYGELPNFLDRALGRTLVDGAFSIAPQISLPERRNLMNGPWLDQRVREKRTSEIRQTMLSWSHPLQFADGVATITYCRRREEICHQGEAANTWYHVIAGTALQCVIKSDGRRQVVDLLFPGDFFGFTRGADFDYLVEAGAPDTIVVGYPRKYIEKQADADPELAREIRRIAVEGLCRVQEQLLILGRVTAQEKVGSFILSLADRLGDGEDDHVTLPISRYDMADYLSVSVETVSRALSDLKNLGLIRFEGTRVIKIVDRGALSDNERH
jgi:CRP/FNR family transcriptional regulator, nitrogen fixation regulation protein